jgi:hypothetical protein
VLNDTATLSFSPVEDPLAGESESQLWSSLAVQLSVPVPEFRTWKLWLAGLCPTLVLAESALVESAIAGTAAGAFTVSVTCTFLALTPEPPVMAMFAV